MSEPLPQRPPSEAHPHLDWLDLELPISDTTQAIHLAQYLAEKMLDRRPHEREVTIADWECDLLMFALDQARIRAASAEKDFHERCNVGSSMLLRNEKPA